MALGLMESNQSGRSQRRGVQWTSDGDLIPHLIRRVVGMLIKDTGVMLMFHHGPNVVVGVGGGGGGVGRARWEVVVVMMMMMAYLLLLLDLFHQDGFLFVLAALVLEPDADDSRRQARHLDQLLLHQGVGTRVGRVAGA